MSLLFKANVSLTLIPPNEPLALRFTNTTFTGEGFDLLTLSFFKEGDPLLSLTFNDLATALLFFESGQVFDFGPPAQSGQISDLDFVFELTSNDPGASFGVGALLGNPAVVPEPQSWVLSLVGLAVLGLLTCRRLRPEILRTCHAVGKRRRRAVDRVALTGFAPARAPTPPDMRFSASGGWRRCEV